MSQAVAIIPARFASSRFPGKILADRTGRTLIQHVHDQVVQAESIKRTLIATDDERIAKTVRAFGGEVVMTRPDHPNGTSRLAEVAAMLEDDVIVNVQGDEPEIEPQAIDLAVQTLQSNPECPVATLATPFSEDENPADANIVKVVLNQRGEALYFSRAPIPHWRDRDEAADVQPLRHVGLYVYRRAFLLEYVTWSETPLERTEKLEQLRILECGSRITVGLSSTRHVGIDTPEQYEAFVQRWNQQASSAERNRPSA